MKRTWLFFITMKKIKNEKRRNVTILELIIAITLILMISSVGFVKLQGNNYKIISFTKQLCSDLRYVRRENMLNNSTVYIRFFQENNRYGYSLHRNKQIDKELTLPQSTKLNYPKNFSDSFIKFNRDGSFVKGGGTITINKGNDYKYITIVPVSGRILYKEGIYEK